MHYYRLSHGGKVCSGDFLEDTDIASDYYLIARGELMWWYMFGFWVILASLLLAILGMVFFTIKSLH